MGRRKRHAIPAEHSVKLHKALNTARAASYAISTSPWMRNRQDVRDAFEAMFQGIARMQRVLSDHHQAIIDAGRQPDPSA